MTVNQKTMRPETVPAASRKRMLLTDRKYNMTHHEEQQQQQYELTTTTTTTSSQQCAGHSPSSVVTSVTSFTTTEEDMPIQRAVRMVVGLSESSLHEEDDVSHDGPNSCSIINPTKESLALHLPPRQESEGTASTTRTSTNDFSVSTSSLTETREGSHHQTSSSKNTVERPLVVKHQDDDDDDDDFSDGFSLKKLYGREEQESQLFEIYDYIVEQKVPRQVMDYVLISGGVGTGKSSLADSLRRKVQCEGGYFCAGSFDQFLQRGPIAPLIDAFADYVQQVLDRGDDEVAIIRTRIRSMVDVSDLPTVLGIVPCLRDLLGEDAPEEREQYCTLKENSVTVSDNRSSTPEKVGSCHVAMGSLMRAISRPERPVVWLLDDLQWGLECPFEILSHMVMDELNDSFMFLGITRSDVGPDAHVSQFLRRIEDQGVRISNIALSNLLEDDIQNMVDDSFLMPQEQSSSLAAFFYECSSGNPFCVTASIQTFQNEPRFLHYDKETNTWALHPDNIDNFMSSCPISLIERKMDTLPREDKKVLMVIACLGSHSTQRMIEAALQEDATESLKKLTKKGKLEYNEKDCTYTIKYNAVRTAAYNLIGVDLQPAFHVEIGLRLMKYLDPEELDEKIYCVLSQLDHGIQLVQDQKVKYDIAALLVRAAEKSAVNFTFRAVHTLLKRAYDLLGPNHWEEAYELTLVLYNYLAEIEFALEDNERVDYLLDEIEKHGRVCYDRLRSFTTRVHVLGVRGQPTAAIERGVKILSCLGVKLPANPGKVNTIWAMVRMDRKLKGKSCEMLLRLPKMSDDIQLACMQVLNLLLIETFLHRNKLFAFVVLKMVKLSLENGVSAMSSVGFAGYGVLLSFAGRPAEAQRFGKLALDLVDRFEASSFRARVIALVYGCIQNSVKPWVDSLEHLKEGHRLGLMTGDFEFAMFNSNLHVAGMLESGRFHVEDVKSDLEGMIHLTESYGHFQQLGIMRSILATVVIYSDPNGDLVDHAGPLDDGLKDALESGNCFFISSMYDTKAFFLMVANEFEKGLELMDSRKKDCPRLDDSVFESLPIALEGFFSFGVARQSPSLLVRKNLIKRGRTAMKRLQKFAIQNPDNCMCKALLLEAEYAALCKKEHLAKQKYSQAIAVAVGTNTSCDIAISNQLACIHYCADLNDRRSGIVHMEAAIKALRDSGGHAAVTIMEQKMKELNDTRRFSFQ